MKISVIIPTYNRSHYITKTIESFANQSISRSNYEIIVVNNNSKDNTQEILEQEALKYQGFLQLKFESRQGVHYARNSASKSAKGEILYFTDDDMIADFYLLEKILEPFNLDNLIGVVTGKILPLWLSPPPKWILMYCQNYLLSLNDKGDDLIISNDDIGAFSCHQAIRRTVFNLSGGFNPENTDGFWIGDGETGLNIKIKELGYKFAYYGESKIQHMIPSTRLNQKYLNKRYANEGNCHVYTEYKKNNSNKIGLIVKIINSLMMILFYLYLTLKVHLKNTVKYFLKFGKVDFAWRIHQAKTFYYLSKMKYYFILIFSEKRRYLVNKKNWLDE